MRAASEAVNGAVLAALEARERAELAAFENEIRAELRYERGLAIKALIAFALVAALLVAHVYFFT